VELAKKFSSEDASAFVNGILDAAAKTFGEKK
jgi:transcription termination factor NusB